MTLSMIKIFLILLLLTILLDLPTSKSCFLTRKYHVHVINKLPSNSSNLKIHCAAGDDERGNHYLAANQEFDWSFCQGFAWTTLYFCHFWWNSKDKVFDVYNDPVHCVNDGKLPKLTTQCAWVVKADGFYLGTYIGPGKVEDMYRYAQW
ncbi:hypothetical protein T459_14254 [Capsicum annuum]|uniref:S-protein homolog n=1 Tax=Capsicum annuum TaxID=4072 RepID=A0A2G2ZGV8_CAPAN|nr:hypothetical protein T459_14254 [Capsicum annuum]